MERWYKTLCQCCALRPRDPLLLQEKLVARNPGGPTGSSSSATSHAPSSTHRGMNIIS